MKYFVGLDGGGTKTKCVVTDENLNILFEQSDGPSAFLHLGTEPVSQTIYKLISKAAKSLKIEISNFNAILIGSTGAGRKKDAAKLKYSFKRFLKNKGIVFNNFYVESDARIALEGAFSGQPGSILIAGTGSIMFGKDKNGKIYRVGGFGKLIGDDGSGFSIGRKGLIAVARYYDGRGSATVLRKLLSDNFKIKNTSQLITEVYQNNFDIALFAPFVINAAFEGDKISKQIIQEESDELIAHVKAMQKRLNIETMKLSLIGGTIANDNFYSKIFKKKIDEETKNVIIQLPDYPPEIGAVLMAINYYKKLNK